MSNNIQIPKEGIRNILQTPICSRGHPVTVIGTTYDGQCLTILTITDEIGDPYDILCIAKNEYWQSEMI